MNVWWGILIIFAALALLFAYLWHVKLRAGIHDGAKCPRGRKGCPECATERARLEARKAQIIAEIPKPLLAIGIVARAIMWFINGR